MKTKKQAVSLTVGLVLALAVLTGLLTTVSLASMGETYTVTVNGTNLTIDDTTIAPSDYYYEGTLTPAEGYALPRTIEVSCGGEPVPMNISSGYWYWADNGRIEISRDFITDDIVITASAIDIPRYRATLSGTNLSLETVSDREGEDYRAILTPAEGYALPQTVTVKLDGETVLQELGDYRWGAGEAGSLYIGLLKLYKANYDYKTIEIIADAVSGSFDVSFGGNGTVFPTGETATAGTDYTVTLTAASGYALPERINVAIGGIGTPTSWYTYDSSTGVLTVPGKIINGELVIGVHSEAILGQPVPVEIVDRRISLGGSTSATVGSDYTAILTAAPGYRLPESIGVISSSDDLTPGTDFTYDPLTGELAIRGSAIMGDIRINADAVPNTYSVTLEGTHVTFSGAANATAGTIYTATLTASEGYTMPQAVTVTVGGVLQPTEKYTYEKTVSGGTVTLYDTIFGDIVIAAEGVVRTHNVRFFGDHLSLADDADAVGNKDYTVKILPDPGYDVPYAVEVIIGANGVAPQDCYSWDHDSGELTVYGQYIDGEILIKAEARQGFLVSHRGTGLSFVGKMVAFSAHDYTAKLIAADGHVLPESITVTAGGITLESGTGYTYDSATGELIVRGNYIGGDIEIAAEGIHVHAFTDEWSGDELYHWRSCGNPGCPETDGSDREGYAPHSFDNDCDTDCNDGCGYTRVITHSPGEEWIAGQDGHWHDCESCGADLDFGGHSYKAEWSHDAERHWHECAQCGFATDVSGHSYKAEWSHDAEWHWHECAQCGIRSDVGGHSFREATCTDQAVCEECGVSVGTVDENAHAWDAGAVTAAPTCSAVGVKTYTCTHNSAHTYTEDVPALGHTYDNACDADCNTCGEGRTPAAHESENADGKCDVCGESFALSGGAIAGIAVGSAAAAGLGGFSLFWFVIKKKKWSDLTGIFKK